MDEQSDLIAKVRRLRADCDGGIQLKTKNNYQNFSELNLQRVSCMQPRQVASQKMTFPPSQP